MIWSVKSFIKFCRSFYKTPARVRTDMYLITQGPLQTPCSSLNVSRDVHQVFLVIPVLVHTDNAGKVNTLSCT